MYTYAAAVVRVIDGDTVELVVDLGFRLERRKDSYRLGRIDAPEMNTAVGPIAKQALETYLTGASVLITTSKADKYGRWLVELFADGVNLNDRLVADGFAVYRTY